jgi:ribosomal subunit interface protein
MNKRIMFKNMAHSDTMQEYVNKKLEKVEKFLKRENAPIYIDVILEQSSTHTHPRVEIRIKTPNFEEVANHEHEGVEIYEAIDRAVDVMYRLLLQHKEKAISERKSRGRHDDFKKQR